MGWLIAGCIGFSILVTWPLWGTLLAVICSLASI